MKFKLLKHLLVVAILISLIVIVIGKAFFINSPNIFLLIYGVAVTAVVLFTFSISLGYKDPSLEIRDRNLTKNMKKPLISCLLAVKNEEKLIALIQEGRIDEAFEKYYGEEVVIQVNGNAPIIGKGENRKRDMIFLQEIEKLNSAVINTITFGGSEDNVSMTEWAINIEDKNGKKKTIYRVNVQHWKDEKIINEKLYFCGDQKF